MSTNTNSARPGETGEPGEPAPSKRRGRPKEPIRRSRLLDISARLFATRGYSNTSIRDIADAAGMTSGSLYHHFPSKEAILDEILREFLFDLRANYAEIEESHDDPQATVDALIEHTLHTIHQIPNSAALFQNEAGIIVGAPGFEWIVENSKEIEAIWVRAIEHGQNAGMFRPELDSAVTYRFIRDSLWSVVRWYRPDGRLPGNLVTDHYLDLLTHALTVT